MERSGREWYGVERNVTSLIFDVFNHITSDMSGADGTRAERKGVATISTRTGLSTKNQGGRFT